MIIPAALRVTALTLAVAAFTAAAATARHPAAGSPNCPPGQPYVDKPGTGWLCAGGATVIFTPPAPSPSGSAR